MTELLVLLVVFFVILPKVLPGSVLAWCPCPSSPNYLVSKRVSPQRNEHD